MFAQKRDTHTIPVLFIVLLFQYDYFGTSSVERILLFVLICTCKILNLGARTFVQMSYIHLQYTSGGGLTLQLKFPSKETDCSGTSFDLVIDELVD